MKQKYDLKDVAIKLHSQFSHPKVDRLIRLVQNSGWDDKKGLIEMIKIISAECTICKEYRIPSPRPVVGFNMATNFNEVLAMDLKFFHGSIILHLIDHVSRFSAAAIVKSKKPEDIIEKIFDVWIKIFGPPKKFFSDNGGEFNNEQYRSLCEAMNIVIETTAAESHGVMDYAKGIMAFMLTC